MGTQAQPDQYYVDNNNTNGDKVRFFIILICVFYVLCFMFYVFCFYPLCDGIEFTFILIGQLIRVGWGRVHWQQWWTQ
ncbi:hypothetical protein Hanom_Chr14g01309561 [Helianthus anomalus]